MSIPLVSAAPPTRESSSQASSSLVSLTLDGLSNLDQTPLETALNQIDQLLSDRWHREGITPAPRCDDATFLRRIYLDLLGRIPRVSEVRTFLEETHPQRREKLIEQLLLRPGHATHLTNQWRQFLLPEGTDLERLGGVAGFETWLRDRFAKNVPYDKIVTELLLAQGSAADSGPQLFYSAWQLQPEKLAASTSRALLGIQLQCAQCHDHPFDSWSQRDFWGYAAFFARISNSEGNNAGPLSGNFQERDSGEVRLPDSDEVIPVRYLGGELVTDQEQTRRQLLAAWIVSPNNPYFARATVNRIWSQLFGRGLVEPPDDMSESNLASHPQVLQKLTQYFTQSNYDLRQLISLLTRTEAYQLSSAQLGSTTAAETKHPTPELFQQMKIKSFSVEQLYDSLATATCRLQSAQLGGPTFGLNRVLDQGRQQFLSKMRTPRSSQVHYKSGIPQSLSLMNSQLTATATDWQSSDLLQSLQAPFFTDSQRITTLFLATLSRPPNSDELTSFVSYVDQRQDAQDSQDSEQQATAQQETKARQKALGDVLWALLNSAEFTLNH